MSGIIPSGIFTTELTSGTLTITESMGVKQISVYNGTATAGTVTGTRKLGSTSSSAINVAESETFTVVAIEGEVITSLTITAPVGCTLKIVAQ